MRTVLVEWHRDEERFTAGGTHPGRTITINAPHAAGEDQPATGFSATELLLAGIGACAAWDVVGILRKAREPLLGLDVRVTGEQAPQPPHEYRSIGVHFNLRGPSLREASVERAVRLSCERYCSVLATVRGVATATITYTILADGE